MTEEPNGDRTTNTWDYENRMTRVELPSGIRNTMAYEPGGLRVKLEESAGTKKFVWDEQNYLAETDENDDTQVVYTNEPRLYGNLVSQRRGTDSHWYHFDAIGSTRELTDDSAFVTDTRLYDAWGRIQSLLGVGAFSFTFVGRMGYYCSPSATPTYVRARYYVPSVGRWSSFDPIGVVASNGNANLFRFVSNRPTRRLDPSGLKDYFIDFHYFFSDTRLVSELSAIQSEVNRIFQECFQKCLSHQDNSLTITWTKVMDAAEYDRARAKFGWVGGRPGPRSGWEGIGEALLCEPACTGLFAMYNWCTKCPDGINIGIHDRFTGTLGSTGENEIGIYPGLIRQSQWYKDKGYSDSIATVIAHESGHHVIADDSLHFTSGFIDSRPGVVGSVFSPNCCERICKAFCLG